MKQRPITDDKRHRLVDDLIQNDWRITRKRFCNVALLCMVTTQKYEAPNLGRFRQLKRLLFDYSELCV